MKATVLATVLPVFAALRKYLSSYFDVLQKHMTQEFEIQIRDGSITPASCTVVQTLQREYDIFQYKDNINRIVGPWVSMLLCHPHQSESIAVIQDLVPSLIRKLEQNITVIQSKILSDRRNSTNRLCAEKCSSPPAIHNLTSIEIPPEILSLLSQGLHIIPENQQTIAEVRQTIESDLKKAAISHYRSVMGFTPIGTDTTMSIDSLMKHLTMNLSCGSPISEFYFNMWDKYKTGIKGFLSSLRLGPKMTTPSEIVQKYLPSDIVITTVDKNLGVALIPIAWYKIQYEAQCQKGGYTLVEMTEAQCINYILAQNKSLWDTVTPPQKQILKNVWPRKKTTKFRLGVLKLLPKIHKLATITKDSWLDLSSRPIRGAEMCPTNAPSLVSISQKYINTSIRSKYILLMQALCTLMQKMIKDFREMFPQLTSTPFGFPVLKGCDEYSERVSALQFESTQFSQVQLKPFQNSMLWNMIKTPTFVAMLKTHSV